MIRKHHRWRRRSTRHLSYVIFSRNDAKDSLYDDLKKKELCHKDGWFPGTVHQGSLHFEIGRIGVVSSQILLKSRLYYNSSGSVETKPFYEDMGQILGFGLARIIYMFKIFNSSDTACHQTGGLVSRTIPTLAMCSPFGNVEGHFF